jgi:hypothetical protein
MTASPKPPSMGQILRLRADEAEDAKSMHGLCLQAADALDAAERRIHELEAKDVRSQLTIGLERGKLATMMARCERARRVIDAARKLDGHIPHVTIGDLLLFRSALAAFDKDLSASDETKTGG